MITACNATSMRRRGSSSVGKNDPDRSFGMFTVTSPLVVVTVFGRVPLRTLAREDWSARGVPRRSRPEPRHRPSDCSIAAIIMRIMSPPSVLRSVSANSSSAD